MKAYKIIFIFALFAVCLSNQQIEAESEPRVGFFLHFDKKEYKVDEPIKVSFRLKNKGSDAVYVNKRFYVNSKDSGAAEKEVFFQVQGPSGKSLTEPRKYDTGLPKTDDFVLLGPGEEVSSERARNLKAYFQMKTPGVYTIEAVYHNACGQEIGLDTFKEKVVSEPHKIKLIEDEKLKKKGNQKNNQDRK